MIMKGVVFIIVAIIISGNGMLIYTQQKNIKKLRHENQQALMLATNMRKQLELTRANSIVLSEILEKQRNRLSQLEGNTHVTREALRKAQASDWCAGQLVPDDVIRLQHKTLKSH